MLNVVLLFIYSSLATTISLKGRQYFPHDEYRMFIPQHLILGDSSCREKALCQADQRQGRTRGLRVGRVILLLVCTPQNQALTPTDLSPQKGGQWSMAGDRATRQRQMQAE